MVERTSSRLTGSIAAITGAGRGIGRAITLAYAREGAKLALCSRTGDGLDAVAAEARSAGAEAVVVARADVRDEGQLQAFANEAQASLGPVDVLVNNAGIHRPGRFLEYELAEWERFLDINVLGVVRAVRVFLPGMLERSCGRIINIASTAGKYGSLYQSPYNTSKHAVVGLTRCLALETAQAGVRVNAICPGFVDTDLVANAGDTLAGILGVEPEQALENLVSRVPIGRMVQPDEVAELAVYLATPSADAMTGQALTISGGMVLV